MATYVGIDVSKSNIDVYFGKVNKYISLCNNDNGYEQLLNELIKHYKKALSKIIVVFEPTGGYEYGLREFLQLKKIAFHCVHPTKVRNYAKGVGILAKTDKLDAKVLQMYAEKNDLKPKSDFKTKSQTTLHNLIVRRKQLIAMKLQENNRLETEGNKVIVDSVKCHFEFIENQIAIMDKEIANITKSDPDIKDKFHRLQSIPGVGPNLAVAAITELPELQDENVTLRQITALVGLAPYARQSGKIANKRHIFAGRSQIREILFMAALSSIRANKRLKAFYDRLRQNHKPAKVALVAVMRKLLGYIYALIKNGSVWDNGFEDCRA